MLGRKVRIENLGHRTVIRDVQSNAVLVATTTGGGAVERLAKRATAEGWIVVRNARCGNG